MTAHAVYPAGPDCNPSCPGDWSEYHDGYADGYERAESAAVAVYRKGLAERVGGLPNKLEFESSWADEQAMYECVDRAAVLALIESES